MNEFQHILVRRHADIVFLTLNQPATRNALSPEMVAEIDGAIAGIGRDASVRALVLRGSQGFFCAGGNVGNFKSRLDASASGEGEACAAAGDPVAARNREFGRFMTRLSNLPIPVLAVVESAAMGGGMGLACAADIVLATRDARFALSETGLGLVPAQIAPFVVGRLGARVARRLGLTGERVRGETAMQLGLVDELASDGAALDSLLAEWLTRICACAPHANAHIKPLFDDCAGPDSADALDRAALRFARCMRDEGGEGIAAFREKRPPAWARRILADDVRRACATTLEESA
ncbi:enoyl-CoA hydratase/isomerase family protein [Achromobacter sp. NPDC058515]|uniref:enoyl-CoA hydratase/isomerase family protein n=1 Tax=Achromobacter sp. NPDC058515 TaxID=3346533 RepID=UPI003668A3A0